MKIKNTLHKLGIISLFFIFGTNSYAEFSKEKPVHHLFNSRLLDVEEWEVQTNLNVKYGLSKNFEVGTSGLLLFGKIPSLYLKHRLFGFDRFELGFTSFSFYFPNTNSGKTYENETVKDSLFFSMHGFVGTIDLIPERVFLNVGPMRTVANSKGATSDRTVYSLNTEIYTLSAGLDWHLSSDWALSGTMLLPIAIEGKTTDDSIESTISLNPSKLSSSARSSIFIVNLTRSWTMFNLECGAIRLPDFADKNAVIPYVNLFWRVK